MVEDDGDENEHGNHTICGMHMFGTVVLSGGGVSRGGPGGHPIVFKTFDSIPDFSPSS